MITIHTKCLPATNTSGTRIKAYTASWGNDKGFSATIGFPHEFDSVLAHFQAVKALVAKNKLEWNLDGMRYGDSADSKGYCFCFDQSTIESR